MESSKYPLVSVLIPAYNEEKYILNVLEAVMNQDYPCFEILVIDNASTDGTNARVQDFIKKHPHAGLRLLVESRQGTGFARECGRREARGEIIAQLDADCLPFPGWIKKGVQRMCSKNTVAVTGPYDYYESPFFIRTLTLLSQLSMLKTLNGLVQWLRRGAIMIGGNSFVKASVLEKAGGYNTELVFYGDDVDMARSLSRWGRVRFCNQLLVKTSSRRYTAQGFLKVQSRYNKFFFDSVLKGCMNTRESMEWIHPR